MKRAFTLISAALLIFMTCISRIDYVEALASDATNYYFGSTVNTGKDNGYSEQNPLELKDPHYNRELGRFVVSGYTRVVKDNNDNPVFLKNLGDKITLSFLLEQDIDSLFGESNLSISEDKKGYDKYFEIEKTNFGRGALIVKHTDFQNTNREPVKYFDYLSGKVANANTMIELLEEGDYEVALNYKIETSNKLLFIPTPSSYNDYRIFFKFSVRNGNCMVYPFDVVTKSELANSSITENGFYLDLAKSRYLDITVKKQVLLSGADELTEDIRFNMIAKSGDQFTDEGVYIITAKNLYTGDISEKRIYVGKNNTIKAFMRTGYSIKEINEQLSLGAQITNDGIIIPPSNDCIVYPFDVLEEIELSDNSITENGFYLDLVKSQHLDVIIIKEVLTNAVDGLIKDTQFNSFAKDGDKYTDDGIYTIFAINRHAEQQTSIRICVGTNNILKAHMKTGFSIKEINERQALGAQITNEGDIIPPLPQAAEVVLENEKPLNTDIEESIDENVTTNHENNGLVVPLLAGIALVLVITIILITALRKRKLSKANNFHSEEVANINWEDESK